MRVFAIGRRTLLAILVLAVAPAGGAAAGTESCADLVAGRVYRCTVKTSFGTAFEDCFRVTRPAEGAPRFDLAADRLREPFGCACEPRGDLRRPRFGRSARFACTGGGTTGSLVVCLAGRISADGHRIRSGTGANHAGDTFVFQCTRDAACLLD